MTSDAGLRALWDRLARLLALVRDDDSHISAGLGEGVALLFVTVRERTYRIEIKPAGEGDVQW